DEGGFAERAVFLEVVEIGPGKRSSSGFTARSPADGDQPFLVADRGVRAEEDAFDPTEDGGVGADAECEAKNRREGKARVAAQYSKGEAEVLKKVPAHFLPAHCRRFLCRVSIKQATRLICMWRAIHIYSALIVVLPVVKICLSQPDRWVSGIGNRRP